MSGAGFLLAINLSVAGLLGAAFLAIAVYDRTRVSARWFALCYALGMVNFAVEFAIPLFGGGLGMVAVAYAAFLAALACFNAGLARMYGMRIPWRLIGALFAASIALKLGVVDALPRESFLRQTLYQLPYSVMQAVGAVLVWRAASRRPLDNLLMGLICLSALHYLAKPFIAAATGGVGAAPDAYAGTAYALFSQSLATVLAMALALLLIIILTRDVLADITAESVTDQLSGVLNRRGFEEHRDAALRHRSANGLPVSLVLCDLDHFKKVNDTYGHATGDLVIVAFARLLREAAAGHHTVARIGGEEFAVLLAGANLASARLFAENARIAFSALPIPGVPDDVTLTASFGVAERLPSESAENLQARADEALYEAKKAGRDRVRLASSERLAQRSSQEDREPAGNPSVD